MTTRLSSARRRLGVQSLEVRNLLAGDVGDVDSAAADRLEAVVMADVNADGAVSAVDALQVINRINAIANGVPGIVDGVLARWDVNGDGSVSAVDALQIINRINGTNPDIVDVAMELLPADRADWVVDRSGPLGESVREFVAGINELRLRGDLPAPAAAGLIGNVARLVGQAGTPSAASLGALASTWQSVVADRELTGVEMQSLVRGIRGVLTSTGASDGRVDAVIDDLNTVIGSVDFEIDDVRRLIVRVQSVLESLPGDDGGEDARGDDSLEDRIEVAAEGLVRVMTGGEPLSRLVDVITDVADEDDSLRWPSFTLVRTFFANYLTARFNDGRIDAGELAGLSGDLNAILESAGLNDDIRTRLVDRFESLFNV